MNSRECRSIECKGLSDWRPFLALRGRGWLLQLLLYTRRVTATDRAASNEPLTRKQLVGLVAMALGVLVVANDFTAFSVALPVMEASLKTDVSTIQWVINGYSLVFGICIVTGGRLADMFGRRKVFVIGAVIFAAFSLVAGLSDSVAVVLGARALMGVGGALLWPATLGMTYALLPPSRAGLAGGLIIGVAGVGNAMGPLLGGLLTDTLGWNWIFIVNLPVAAIGILVVLSVIERDTPPEHERGVDYVGIVTLSVALFGLLLALDMGADRGWTSLPMLGLFALAVLGLAAFGGIERAIGTRALVPSAVLRNPVFLASMIVTLLNSAVFFAVILYIPQFMLKALGFSPMQSGAGLLPLMVTFAITSFVAGSLYARLGAKLSVCGGTVMLAAGMFLLSRVHADTLYMGLVPGMMVLGVGIGLFYSSITTAAITALDPRDSSLGGAIVYMCQVAGGAVGLGVNTAIVMGAPSLADGISRAFVLDGVLSAIGAVVALLFVRGQAEVPHAHGLVHRHRAHG